jgi:hypothetical protein
MVHDSMVGMAEFAEADPKDAIFLDPFQNGADSLNSGRWCDQVKFSDGGSFYRTKIPFRGSTRPRRADATARRFTPLAFFD